MMIIAVTHAHKRKDKSAKMFSLFGNNAAGIKSKTETFFNVIDELECSAFLLQETLLTRKGLIKIDGFQTFELLRSSQG